MASRRPGSGDDAPEAVADSRQARGPAEVARRAPFAINPRVGARGQRTQQRILDAALEVFGEEGYDACGIDPIAKRAGCSRAAFYQYFSSKEDVFRHLAGQVARQLDASTEALEPLTPDEEGWQALRAWVSRRSAIYSRYQPVFGAFQAASASDDAVATGSARWGVRAVSRIRSKIVSTTLRPRELDPVIAQLLGCAARTHDVARILRSAAPARYGQERVGDALADVAHRALFGLQRDINTHAPLRHRPPRLRFDPRIRDEFRQLGQPPELTSPGRRTREALMDAGRKAFREHGYHRSGVADIVGAAGVSRGAFYRYFENKDQLARALAMRAMQTVSRALAGIPVRAVADGPSGRALLRRWLRRYCLTQSNETAVLRVWVDAALQDAALQASSAPALDWGRRAMVRFLEPRGFGDVETEGLVMVALLSSFGARQRMPTDVGAAAHVIAQGLLGLPR